MSESVLPAGWIRGNIRRFAQMKTGHTPSRSNSEYWDNVSIPWFTLADVWQLRSGERTYLGETASSISEAGLANSAAELLPTGTVVLSRTASVGFSGIMPQPMATSQDYWNWVCGPELLPEYLNYQFKSMRPVFDSLVMGSTHKTIYQADAAGLRITVPPFREQLAIADYLDRETQRIDELIAEQRGLIETLRERRVALISRAVRRGLDESVEMKKTGIDWLGEVPSHWDVRRLKYSMESVVPGVWGSDPLGDESDVLCVRVADFDRPRLQVGQDVRTVRSVKSSDRLSRLLEPEDLLIEKSGGTAINPVGFVAMYAGPGDTAVYANFISRMRPAEGQSPRYWLYAHAASYATRLTARSVKQTTGIQNLDQTSYFDEKFPFPPADEQQKIAEFLDGQSSRIDELISESEDLIALSQERRAALITAAVTGQIDVRSAA